LAPAIRVVRGRLPLVERTAIGGRWVHGWCCSGSRAGGGARAVGATVLASGSDIRPEDIYAALRAGHPVVAWITVDYRPTTLHWYRAFDGATAWYSTLEHAVTLVGVSPDAVLVDDPARRLAWHSRAEFEAGFELLHRMAVILE